VIPNEFIQTLLARVDIVAVIDRAVPLKKAGQNLAACCPFHKEKSPSFTVSPSKQFYHCFGCGAHGTAISFLMEYQGKSFPDAVEELAHSVGMDVPRDEQAREAAQAAGGLFEVLLTAAQHYKNQLKLSEEGIAYFKARGVSGEMARTFHLGYAPDKWQGLEAAFEHYADPALEQAGLVIVGDGSKRYDRFRGRVMFPILNQQGRVIGFGGRVLGEGEPKYLNSPETAVFSKGRELYGLYQAQKAIRDSGRVLVVEGYMDVIALHQYGIHYAVATLGTATTDENMARLFRLTDEVVFSFDGDAAGQRAAWKALENALPALQDGKTVKFLFLPKEHDPDSYVRELGTEAFAQHVREAEPLSRYWLRTLQARHPEDTPEARAGLLAEAKTYLAGVQAPLMRDVLLREVAAAARVDAGELSKNFGPAVSKPQQGAPTYSKSPERAPSEPPQQAYAPHDDHDDAPAGGNWMPASLNDGYGKRQDGSNQGKGFSKRFGRAAPLGRPAPKTAPISVFERLLRLGLDNPELLFSLEDDDIASNHPDGLLLQSAVRLVKTTSSLPHTAAEVIALAGDASLAEALQDRVSASMSAPPLKGKELEDEWRECLKKVRESKSSAVPLYMRAK
jgi:DNA primase